MVSQYMLCYHYLGIEPRIQLLKKSGQLLHLAGVEAPPSTRNISGEVVSPYYPQIETAVSGGAWAVANPDRYGHSSRAKHLKYTNADEVVTQHDGLAVNFIW